jgi:hypothetical protein
MSNGKVLKEESDKILERVFDKKVELPVIPLIDGASGIYAYNELVSRYKILVETDFEGKTIYKPLDEYLADYNRAYPKLRPEFPETVFSPKNDVYLDNIVDFEDKLFVRGDNGIYYRVVSDNGDIYAVDPRAEYDEETDTYYFPENEKKS